MEATERIKQVKAAIPKRETCRTCNSKTVDFLDFGDMPLAGAFLKPDRDVVELLYPMQVSFCPQCTLVQIPNVIPKEVFFNENYHYFSSVTATLNWHFEEYADFLEALTGAFASPMVLEFGCNDGVLLSKLHSRGINCIGVDASSNVVNIGRGRGLSIVAGFFDAEMGERLSKKGISPTVITGSNVFAHNDDVEKVLQGVQVLLNPAGYFIVEVHYLLDLIRDLQFDFFYHEHCNYYSLHSISILLRKFGLTVVDVKRLSLHGGAIRVVSRFSDRSEEVSRAVPELLEEERRQGLNSLETYQRFAAKVHSVGETLREQIISAHASGKSITGYGASGRSATLLNYLGEPALLLNFMVDESPVRANHLMPGIHTRIVSPEVFKTESPGLCFITAWPYAKEIIQKENWFLENGGTFIVPLPKVEVIRN